MERPRKGNAGRSVRKGAGERGAARIEKVFTIAAGLLVVALLIAVLYRGKPPRALESVRPAAACTPTDTPTPTPTGTPTPTPYYSWQPSGMQWVH